MLWLAAAAIAAIILGAIAIPPTPEVVASLGIRRKPSALYFIDHDGNVRERMSSDAGMGAIIAPSAVRREQGYYYFVTKEGDVARFHGASKLSAIRIAIWKLFEMLSP